jgi:hypothetical protein
MDYKNILELIVNGTLLSFISFQLYQMNGKLATLTANLNHNKERISEHSSIIESLSSEIENVKITTIESKLKSEQALMEAQRLNRA